MTVHSNKLPKWAIRNTVLLFVPIVLGFLAFPSFGIWYIPEPSLWLYALLVIIAYYGVVIQICQRSSGANIWASFRKSSPGLAEYVGSIVGLALFSFIAYQTFFIVGPAVITSITGASVTKVFTVSSVGRRGGSCGTEVQLVEVSPALGRGFCLNSNQVNNSWVRGSRITLSGKESMLGFRVTGFGL